MKKEPLNPTRAAQAIGPYSQAVKLDKLIYSSGQIALDPTTGELVPGGIKEQAKRIMENIKILLEAGGSSLENILKTSIYLTSMDHFGDVNEVYSQYFKKPFPARSTIAVLGLPKGALVEIDFVALSA
mgnify:CR=1 FL=1